MLTKNLLTTSFDNEWNEFSFKRVNSPPLEIFKQRLEIYETEKHGFKHQKADVMRLYLISPSIQRVYYL